MCVWIYVDIYVYMYTYIREYYICIDKLLIKHRNVFVCSAETTSIVYLLNLRPGTDIHCVLGLFFCAWLVTNNINKI